MGIEYSFSDTETGGMLEDGGHEQRYEQAFQLAIVATDAEFNEIETHDLRARRKPNYIPSAGAQATTGILPKETDTYKTSEYDMATSMFNYIKANPGSTWIYWNMKFDTPVKRQTSFRALRDPLPTTSNGNTRADGMRIFKAAYCFDTQSKMVFPTGYQNKPSLKLGNVAAANGVVLIGAHDGVNDTRALMRVCKVIKDRDPKTWDHMMNLRTAQGVDNFLSENLLFMWTPPDATTYYTSAFCYVAHKGQGLVVSQSTNLKKSSNELLIANLAVDPETWRHKSDRDLLLILKGRNPDNPSEWLPSQDQPFKIIKRNDQPVMWPYMDDPCLIPGDTARSFTDREREVSRRRDSRLSALTREELEARRQSIQGDKALCDRLSVLADRMWKIWDNDKKMWVERDSGPKLLEDRIYDGIGLNMPQKENGQLRMFRNWFHSRPWEEREDIAMKFGELFKKPDEALRQSDSVQYEQQKTWRDYAVTMKRLAMIVLYEQERVHDCPGAYLKDPANRYWVEQYIYTRMTQPAVDSKGEPLKKPKYRTLDDAERLANDDLTRYHRELDTKRQRGELTPDLSEEYARRIEMTETCLEYYAEMRANLKEPVAPPPAVTRPTAEPPVSPYILDQYHAPDDHDPHCAKNPVYGSTPMLAPAPVPKPAPKPAAKTARAAAPTPAFEAAKKPAPKTNKAKKKKAAKAKAKATNKPKPNTAPAKSAIAKAAESIGKPAIVPKPLAEKRPVQGALFTRNGNPTRQAFMGVARRSPSTALNIQGHKAAVVTPAKPAQKAAKPTAKTAAPAAKKTKREP